MQGQLSDRFRASRKLQLTGIKHICYASSGHVDGEISPCEVPYPLPPVQLVKDVNLTNTVQVQVMMIVR